MAILYVPVVGFAAPVACLLISPSVATLEVWIADLWGPRRGALVWPILAATAAEAFAVVAAVAAPVIYFAIVGFENLSGLNNIGQIGMGIGVAMVTGGVVAMLGVPIAASVAYDLTAIPKDPGDDGTALPGVLLPYQSPTAIGNAAAADASPNAMPRR